MKIRTLLYLMGIINLLSILVQLQSFFGKPINFSPYTWKKLMCEKVDYRFLMLQNSGWSMKFLREDSSFIKWSTKRDLLRDYISMIPLSIASIRANLVATRWL